MHNTNISIIVFVVLTSWIQRSSTLPRQDLLRLGDVDFSRNTVTDCDKKSFLETFMKFRNGKEHQELNLSVKRIEDWQTCSQYTKKCSQWSGTMKVSIVKDLYERLQMQLDVYDLSNQDCWGLAVEKQFADKLNNKQIKKTYYFDFKQNQQISTLSKKFHIKWDTTYIFTVLPLPSGNPVTTTFKSPSKCEMEVLDVIHDKIAMEDIYVECDEIPDYDSRRKIAEEVCQKQTNLLDAKKIAKYYLYEENCELLLKSF